MSKTDKIEKRSYACVRYNIEARQSSPKASNNDERIKESKCSSFCKTPSGPHTFPALYQISELTPCLFKLKTLLYLLTSRLIA